MLGKTPCKCEYVYTCHILATTGSFGCASSVTVSEVLQGQQQVLKEKQITTVKACSEMSFACDRWVLRAHTAAHDVAMALRSSGIDVRTYLCRAPLDRIDVRTPQCRTHSHSRDSWLKISK